MTCKNPKCHIHGKNDAEFYGEVKETIGKAGQVVIGVEDDAEDPTGNLPFSYTIGNHELGLPELLIIGPPPEIASIVLNATGREMRKRGRAWRSGELAPIPGKAGQSMTMKILTADQRGGEEYAVQAARYYDLEPKELWVQQVVLPDPDGAYPPNCKEPSSIQPLIGSVAN